MIKWIDDFKIAVKQAIKDYETTDEPTTNDSSDTSTAPGTAIVHVAQPTNNFGESTVCAIKLN